MARSIHDNLHPGWLTMLFIMSLGLIAICLPSDSPEDIFFVCAVGLGSLLALSTGFVIRRGIRNILQTDYIMLWVLYGLTFFEFLFPQPQVNSMLDASMAQQGAYATLLGFGGIVVGRHLWPTGGIGKSRAMIQMRPIHVFQLFVLAFVVGFFHIFVSVNFDPFEVVRQFALPRFSQPWSREQFGGAYSLLYELGMLIYLIPPLAGLMLARHRDYGWPQKVIAVAVLCFTMYYGFSLGTRNILGTYVITFLAAYFLSLPRLTLKRALFIGLPTLICAVLAMYYMIDFRTTGLSKFSFSDDADRRVYVDYNLVVICRLVDAFPSVHDYLGIEVPINVLVRPVPRVLWQAKPEGLSVTMESVVGAVPSTSVSSTFVGEAYMSAGFAGVAFAGLLFGALAQAWNRVGRLGGSQFMQLLYVSGLISAAIVMRSMFWALPMALPAMCLWLFGRFYLPKTPLTIRS